MVGGGVDDVLRVRERLETVWGAQRDGFPMESGGELKSDVGERGRAGVFDGEDGVGFEVRGCRGEVDVQIPVGEGERTALGVGGEDEFGRMGAGG